MQDKLTLLTPGFPLRLRYAPLSRDRIHSDKVKETGFCSPSLNHYTPLLLRRSRSGKKTTAPPTADLHQHDRRPGIEYQVSH